MLTDKQKLFAESIAAGATQAEAYKAAYNTSGSAENTIAANASKEAKKPEIAAYIEKLKTREKNARSLADERDKNYKITFIWERIAEAQAERDHAAIARYLDQLHKLQGDYINNTDLQTDNKPLTDLSTDELKALLTS